MKTRGQKILVFFHIVLMWFLLQGVAYSESPALQGLQECYEIGGDEISQFSAFDSTDYADTVTTEEKFIVAAKSFNELVRKLGKLAYEVGFQIDPIEGGVDRSFLYNLLGEVAEHIETQEQKLVSKPIYDQESLIAIGASVESLQGDYILLGDIELTDNFAPIGSEGMPFTGIFDGNGHTISNLDIDSSSGYLGLFASNGGTIKNLHLDSVSLSGSSSNVGALAGYNSGSVVDCFVTNINITCSDNVGGLVGRNNGSIRSSYTEGPNVEGINRVGGLIGLNGGDVDFCFSVVEQVIGVTSAGGLIGEDQTGLSGLTRNWWYNSYNIYGVGSPPTALFLPYGGVAESNEDFYGEMDWGPFVMDDSPPQRTWDEMKWEESDYYYPTYIME